MQRIEIVVKQALLFTLFCTSSVFPGKVKHEEHHHCEGNDWANNWIFRVQRCEQRTCADYNCNKK